MTSSPYWRKLPSFISRDLSFSPRKRLFLMCAFMNVFQQTRFESTPLQWRHNERDGVSNHQPHDCLLNRLFKAQIKENINAPRYWPLWGYVIHRWPVESPHKGPVTRKMFPFDDVIMTFNTCKSHCCINKEFVVTKRYAKCGNEGVHSTRWWTGRRTYHGRCCCPALFFLWRKLPSNL